MCKAPMEPEENIPTEKSRHHVNIRKFRRRNARPQRRPPGLAPAPLAKSAIANHRARQSMCQIVHERVHYPRLAGRARRPTGPLRFHSTFSRPDNNLVRFRIATSDISGTLKLLRHLSRITTTGRRFIPQIDGLRFVAIAWVALYHACEMSSFHLGKTSADEIREGSLLYQAFSAGHFGVHLFFAISGFILSLPFAKYYCGKGEPVRLRAYFIRRITRIEPPYIIHLAFLFVVSALVLRHLPTHPYLYHNPQWASYISIHLLASLVYL